jgi:hypothetical protein
MLTVFAKLASMLTLLPVLAIVFLPRRKPAPSGRWLNNGRPIILFIGKMGGVEGDGTFKAVHQML